MVEFIPVVIVRVAFTARVIVGVLLIIVIWRIFFVVAARKGTPLYWLISQLSASKSSFQRQKTHKTKQIHVTSSVMILACLLISRHSFLSSGQAAIPDKSLPVLRAYCSM